MGIDGASGAGLGGWAVPAMLGVPLMAICITYGEAANQLTSLAEPGGSCSGTISDCTTFGVNNNGQRTSTTYPGNTVMSVTLDNSGRPTEVKAVHGSSTISDFSYTYTKAGSDTELAQTRTDNKASLVTTYGYDALDELTSAVEKSGSTTTAAWTYCYDNAGNRTHELQLQRRE